MKQQRWLMRITGLMNSRPLRMLIVADDRNMLRQLSRFLNAFGYEVQQAAEPELAQAALEGKAPDVLIVDSHGAARRVLELCRRLDDRDDRRCIYTFLLIGDHKPEDLVEALAAGVDDFLATPIVYGELLARLRAAVRNLEFERRLREQDYVEPCTGLLSRHGFRGRLNREFSQSGSPDGLGTCVAADLDFLEGINRNHGFPTGDLVLQAAANKLIDLCGESAVLACFGGGRFAVWLSDLAESEGVEWAERARADVAEMEIPTGETTVRVTASLGVAARAPGVATPDEFIERAIAALCAAKNSGRNCVVRFGQFDDEAMAWEQLAAPGKLFERTVARDVMAPCAAVLRSDQSIERARSLFQKTRLSALPVVDGGGKLVGLLHAEQLSAEDARGRKSEKIADRMTTDMAVYKEDASFAELFQFFKQDFRSQVIIVDQGRPTGFVTPRILASLSEPLKTDSFAPDLGCTHASDDLVVSEPCLALEL